MSQCQTCGHEKRQHIYEEGACRPGFVCEKNCKEFAGSSSDISVVSELLNALKILDHYAMALYQEAKGRQMPANHSIRRQVLDAIARAEGRKS